MTEYIIIKATHENGAVSYYNWYENESASLEDCFETENELVWYILESIRDDDRFEKASRIEAKEVLVDGVKDVHMIEAIIERR